MLRTASARQQEQGEMAHRPGAHINLFVLSRKEEDAAQERANAMVRSFSIAFLLLAGITGSGMYIFAQL